MTRPSVPVSLTGRNRWSVFCALRMHQLLERRTSGPLFAAFGTHQCLRRLFYSGGAFKWTSLVLIRPLASMHS